ncbi:MAG: hypothetical protein ABI040_11520 [Rhodoferax sp.]
MTQLTAINPATDVAFVALLAESARPTEIGGAQFSAQVDGSNCE